MQIYYKSKRYELKDIMKLNNCKLSMITVKKRLLRGWGLADAINTPSQPKEVPITDHKGKQYASIKELCKAYHFSEKLFRHRRYAGWSVKRILTEPKHRYRTY